MKRELINFRNLASFIAFVLFMGAVILPIFGKNHLMIKPLFLGAYLLFIFCSIFTRQFSFMVLFLLFAVLTPLIELFQLTGYTFHVREFFLYEENTGLFTYFGGGWWYLFPIGIPGIIFAFKCIHFMKRYK